MAIKIKPITNGSNNGQIFNGHEKYNILTCIKINQQQLKWEVLMVITFRTQEIILI